MGDVFISHSEQDAKLIRDIAASLRNIDLDVYVEEYETNYGKTIADSICEAIDLCNTHH